MLFLLIPTISVQFSPEITKELSPCLKKHDKRVFANVCLPVSADCIQRKLRIFPHVLFQMWSTLPKNIYTQCQPTDSMNRETVCK